ncbi:MAG: hypothetical protein CME60_06585 [Halobacteriovoraceae bacterium]|nr:hypothetical protein [Halobacteriovoraceae bacterium]|tara:strand:+ start:362 stop:835 length:474 start_codon:yes stop_codon:yes gene_type:complete
MKNLLLSVLSIFLINEASASRDFNINKFEIKSPISLQELKCVIPVGLESPIEERMHTQMTDFYIMNDREGLIEVEHELAFAQGCDLDRLDELKQLAIRTRFGFADSVVTLTKETQIRPFLYNGKCVRNIVESLEIDFGQGTLLKTSRRSILKEATGC